jgi:hypothetical protein
VNPVVVTPCGIATEGPRRPADFGTRGVPKFRYGSDAPAAAGGKDDHQNPFAEFTMTGTEGSSLTGNRGNLLRMFLAIEEAKESIRLFEAGEITIAEAVRRLTTAGTGDAGEA